MRLDLTFHDGDPDKPAVILIHGLGMDRHFWGDPQACAILGGAASLSLFLSMPPLAQQHGLVSFGVVDPAVRGLWGVLGGAGYSLAAWSQREPLGLVGLAVEELQWVAAEAARRWPGKPLFLVGHSRGGIAARLFLLTAKVGSVHGLVTICTPHHGTKMASLATFLHPVGQVLTRILPAHSSNTVAASLQRVADFLQSPATEELQPDSQCIKLAGSTQPTAVRSLSIGGTDPCLFTMYVLKGKGGWTAVSYSDLLAKVVPDKMLPDELARGCGDGLVSAASAVLPGALHIDFPKNHVATAFHSEMHRTVLEFLAS